MCITNTNAWGGHFLDDYYEGLVIELEFVLIFLILHGLNAQLIHLFLSYLPSFGHQITLVPPTKLVTPMNEYDKTT